MTMLLKVTACALFMGMPVQVHGKAFLGRYPEQAPSEQASWAFEHAILGELETILGSEYRTFIERRLSKIEEVVSPIFLAMPHNEHGKLGHAAISYVLHRIFVQRHAWFIPGLERRGKGEAAVNGTSPSTLFVGKVPEYVPSSFENRISSKGMGVHEIAVLAASLEHLVHREAVDRLQLAYKVHHFSPDDVTITSEAVEILDTYMAVYILGFLLKKKNEATPDDVLELREHVPQIYPTWPDTQKFIREVQESVAPKRNYLYFSDTVTVIEEAGERYGRWQDLECRTLKETLLSVEDTGPGGAGRVRIADFYGLALNEGKWQFSESLTYLRDLGALDESDSQNPRVIITNYISGPSNCVASSSYYQVCCIDECEDLLAHLEQKLAKPHAYPKEISAIVGSLRSPTQQTHRQLSPWLLKQLDSVAAQHGGVVPLHSRLFSQWMHFAYPRECQYPHVSGTITPKNLEAIVESPESVDEATANEDEMKHHFNSMPARVKEVLNASAHEQLTMLSMKEELVA